MKEDVSIALAERVTQERFGEHVGIGQPAVSDLLARGVLLEGGVLGEWLLAYARHLREQVVARGADSNLAHERARLAREQADRIAMENASTRRQLVPVDIMSAAIVQLAREVVRELDAIVPRVQRRLPGAHDDLLAVIESELVKVRARAGIASLADVDADDGDEEDTDALSRP